MGGGGKRASQLPRPTVALVQGACAEWGHEGAQQLLMRLRAQKHPNPFSLHTLCAPKVASPTWVQTSDICLDSPGPPRMAEPGCCAYLAQGFSEEPYKVFHHRGRVHTGFLPRLLIQAVVDRF